MLFASRICSLSKDNPVIWTILRWLAACFFTVAGLNHFHMPDVYLSIIPPYLPWPRELVAISGVAEVLGGIGILIPPVRRLAAWGLIALLLAVLPANVQMALHGFRNLPAWALWLRLPFQAVFIAWIYACCLAKKREADAGR